MSQTTFAVEYAELSSELDEVKKAVHQLGSSGHGELEANQVRARLQRLNDRIQALTERIQSLNRVSHFSNITGDSMALSSMR